MNSMLKKGKSFTLSHYKFHLKANKSFVFFPTNLKIDNDNMVSFEGKIVNSENLMVSPKKERNQENAYYDNNDKKANAILK